MLSIRFLYHQIRNAIIFIQACYRGYRVRKQLKQAKEQHRQAARKPPKKTT